MRAANQLFEGAEICFQWCGPQRGLETVDTAESSVFRPSEANEDHHPHACMDGLVFLTYTVFDENPGDEVEIYEVIPCSRCADSSAPMEQGQRRLTFVENGGRHPRVPHTPPGSYRSPSQSGPAFRMRPPAVMGSVGRPDVNYHAFVNFSSTEQGGVLAKERDEATGRR